MKSVSHVQRANANPARISSATLVLALMSALSMLIAGCDGASKSGTPSKTASAPTQAEVDEDCAIIIGTIHDAFQLDRLEMTTTLVDGVAQLNDWQRACGSGQAAVDLPKDIAKILTADQLESLKSAQFSLRDGKHLQDGVMLRAIAGAVLNNQAAGISELDKVVGVFQFVVRSIELTPDIPNALALTPYEICELGKGTAADRAWIFADLLKQARMDAVVIASAKEPAEGAGPPPFLVGVPIEGQVYLFDPALGLPIPPPPGPAAPAVATLEQAATVPEVFRQLDALPDATYPIAAADLEQLNVAVITERGYWSERMRSLQGNFTGDQSMVVSDPLQDVAEIPGLWSRIAAAGGSRWSLESLTIWPYPDAQLTRHMRLTDGEHNARATIFAPFYAYVTVVPDPKTGQFMIAEQEELADPAAGKFDPAVVMRKRTTVRAQLRARLKHLGGDYKQSVMDYHDVWQQSKRVLEFGPPAGLRVMHAQAMDDATFWTALCKFEQGDHQVAIDNAQNYRRKYPLGAWRRQARYLMALSQAALGDNAAAIKELSGVDSKDPEYLGYRWLIRQWGGTSNTSAEGE